MLTRLDRNRIHLAFAASILIPLMGYLLTLSPTVQSLDSAELATGSYLLGIVHATGYPLYLLLGKLFSLLPFGDIAYRVNLMSAVFAALTCGTVYGVSLKLTKSWCASLSGALFWGFSFYCWQAAVVAEVYTLQTFLTGALLWLLLRWDEQPDDRLLYAFAGLFGLSLGNHVAGALLVLGFAFLILSKGRARILHFRLIAGLMLCFVAGLTIYLYLPIRYLADPPLNYVKSYYDVDLTTPQGLLWMVSGQMYRFFAFGYPLAEAIDELYRYFGWLWRNFLGVGILIGTLGLVYLFQKRRMWVITVLLMLIPNVAFFVNYRVIDKEAMFLPAHMMWGLLIAPGCVLVAKRWPGFRASLPVALERGFSAALLVVAVVFLSTTQVFANHQWVDHGDGWQWRESGEKVLAEVGPNALIASRWPTAVVLEYLQLVEGQRSDVTIFNRSRYSVAQFYHLWRQGVDVGTSLAAIEQRETAYLNAQAGNQPVYLVDLDLANQILDEFFYLPTILKSTDDGP